MLVADVTAAQGFRAVGRAATNSAPRDARPRATAEDRQSRGPHPACRPDTGEQFAEPAPHFTKRDGLMQLVDSNTDRQVPNNRATRGAPTERYELSDISDRIARPARERIHLDVGFQTPADQFRYMRGDDFQSGDHFGQFE